MNSLDPSNERPDCSMVIVNDQRQERPEIAEQMPTAHPDPDSMVEREGGPQDDTDDDVRKFSPSGQPRSLDSTLT